MTNEEVLARVSEGLGYRLNVLLDNEDDYQNFWLGVYEAIKMADFTRDVVPYLIIKGYSKISQERRRDNRHIYVAYCGNCNRYRKHYQSECYLCHGSLQYMSRCEAVEDTTGYVMDIDRYVKKHHIELRSSDEDIINRLAVEQYIDRLGNEDKRYAHIAKRLFIDRVDLLVDNYCKQLSRETGMGVSTIANRVTKIRRELVGYMSLAM
jgi:hypothetical protein